MKNTGNAYPIILKRVSVNTEEKIFKNYFYFSFAIKRIYEKNLNSQHRNEGALDNVAFSARRFLWLLIQSAFCGRFKYFSNSFLCQRRALDVSFGVYFFGHSLSLGVGDWFLTVSLQILDHLFIVS